MTDKLLLVANWKSHKTPTEMRVWLDQFTAGLGRFTAGQRSKFILAIAAPFTLLDSLQTTLRAVELSPLVVTASQDVSPYPPGPYTGAVAAELLSDLGVRYCLIGHSERRRYFTETTVQVGQKFTRAVESQLQPIVCAQDRQEIPPPKPASSPWHLMYEPSSAISSPGDFHPEDPDQIRATLADWAASFPSARLLYGGSVSPDNVGPILSAAGEFLSGFVVGQASLLPEPFLAIIQQCLSASF